MAPKVLAFEIVLAAAAKQKKQTLRFTQYVSMPCDCTKGRETVWRVDGEWATGIELSSGYTPARGELVKNHTMVCTVCGSEQGS